MGRRQAKPLKTPPAYAKIPMDNRAKHMARQPFYHRCDVSLLANSRLSESTIEPLLETGMRGTKGYVRGSAQIEVMPAPTHKKGQYLHVATILFTATRELTFSKVRAALCKAFANTVETLSIQHFEDPEPGDPSDL
jgi:hypothetical protein